MTLDFNLSAGAAYIDDSYDQQIQQVHHQHYNQNHQGHHQHAHSQNQSQNQTSNSHPYSYSTASNSHITPITPTTMTNTRSWPVGLDMGSNSHPGSVQATSPRGEYQANSPSSHASSPNSAHSSLQHSPFSSPPNHLTDWALHQQQQQQQAAMAAHHRQQQAHHHMPTTDLSQFMQDPTLMAFNAFSSPFQPNPLEYIPPTTQAALQANLLESPFHVLPSMEGATHGMQWANAGVENWHDFQNTLHMDGLPRMGSVGSNSPTGTYLEVLSLPSSSGDGWALVDWNQPNLDHLQQTQAQGPAIFNPSQTLHIRSHSDSSDGANSLEFGSFEEIQPFSYSAFSPESDGHGSDHRGCYSADGNQHVHETVSPPARAAPVSIKAEASSSRRSPGSGAGSTSPPSSVVPRRNSGPRKSPIAKSSTNKVTRRISNGKKDGTVEKKVGRRKGPLLPEQRKQASEIRKLRACLRCKFLKKTCDKGEPCGGCQPAHARLWQVPCTRIDIKDIGYFMKDWKADYERHMSRGVSVYNVKGFAQKETLMWITHGYGFALPVMVRQVYVADETCFNIDWIESHMTDQDPIDFETRTEKLDVGAEGVSLTALAEYLDKHIDRGFEDFIDDHFEGTPFITEILKTAHRFYVKEKKPIIRKALKLVLAYNLTMHITMVESQGSEAEMDGQIDDEDSKYYGRTVAPVMINFQIKCALADMWRELQKEILEELSILYTGVYTGDKLKNWPTIFMLASILLAVWEEMQFDCHFRVPDPVAVNKFCNDMESTPIGVIVGLFHAISVKLPAFADWDSVKHGNILDNNKAVCEAMTEVKHHVHKHEKYLRTRKEATFDRYDFDSLSNKFVSKLVIRAN